jgi:hypothetical protein
MGLCIRRRGQRHSWFKDSCRLRSGMEASIQKLKKILLSNGKLTVRGLIRSATVIRSLSGSETSTGSCISGRT